MNFRHVEVFFAVMREGSVTAAARSLGISQPSVTTTIKQAESSLGFNLFEREGGRLIPTEEARVLYEEAERAHQALHAFERLSAKLREGLAGHVRIATTTSLSLEVVPDALVRFRQKYPNYSVEVSTFNSDEIVNRLDARMGTHHLGFTYGTGNHEGLSSREIGSLDLYVLVPSDWGLPKNTPVSQLMSTGKPFIAAFSNTPLGMAVDAYCRQKDVSPTVVATAHSHLMAMELVKRGMGFTILDTLTAHFLRQSTRADKVNLYPLREASKVSVTAVFPSGRTLSNPSWHFLDLFREAFRKMQAAVKNEL